MTSNGDERNVASRDPNLVKVVAALGLLLLLIGCTHSNQRYPLQGQVLSRNITTNEVTVTHAPIPGFMPAMTATFPVNDPAIVQQLHPGDSITADLVVGRDEKNWLENVHIAEQSGLGRKLYHDNCTECHDNPQPDLHKPPPDLHGLFRKASLPSGSPATDKQIHQLIISGIGTMPAFDQRLTDRDVEALVKYLHELQ